MRLDILFISLFLHPILADGSVEDSSKTDCGGIQCYVSPNESEWIFNCSTRVDFLASPQHSHLIELQCQSDHHKVHLAMKNYVKPFHADSLASGALRRFFSANPSVKKLSLVFFTLRRLQQEDFDGVPRLSFFHLWKPLEFDWQIFTKILNVNMFQMKLQCEAHNDEFPRQSSMFVTARSWIISLSSCQVNVTCGKFDNGSSLVTFYPTRIPPGKESSRTVISDQCRSASFHQDESNHLPSGTPIASPHLNSRRDAMNANGLYNQTQISSTEVLQSLNKTSQGWVLCLLLLSLINTTILILLLICSVCLFRKLRCKTHTILYHTHDNVTSKMLPLEI